MKRTVFKILLFMVAITTNISCEKGKSGKEMLGFGEIRPGETIEKTLTLSFNTEAVEDSSAFIEFVFVNEKGEIPQNIKFTVDGIVTESNSLKFYAKNFTNQKGVKIGIRFPAESPQKEYSGKFMIRNASDELSLGITHGEEKLPAQVGESVGIWKAVYNDPIPWWIKMSITLAAILILVFLIYFILTRNNMPFGYKTFRVGMITFPNCDAKVTNVRLNDLAKYDLSSAFDGLEGGLMLEPVDKIHSGRKMRFARLKNTTNTLNLKVLHDDVEEILGTVEVLYHQDEIAITTSDNKNYLFRYSNNKIIRKI